MNRRFASVGRVCAWLLLCLGLASCTGWAQAVLELGATEPACLGRPVLLRVMTYNVHHGAGPAGEPRLDEMARFLNDNRLDLIGLQEIDRNWSDRSGFRDQAAELSRTTGMYATFFPTLTQGQDSGYGLAILSRFPSVRQVSGLYSQAREPRGYLAVEVQVAGRQVSFVVTHLGLDAAERARQIEELAAAIETLPGPLVLAGDFNCRPEDPATQVLTSSLKDALSAVGRSAEGTLLTADGTPGARIDFLFATPEWRIEDSLVPGVQYSDHRPVVAYLSFYVERSEP
ncbi:MAG: endonuclease/exonuclease/phosphatase family protein [Bacteroidota bacterium]